MGRKCGAGERPTGGLSSADPSSDFEGLRPTPVYDAFWLLAAERQEIFFRRVNGEKPPWTTDSILTKFKFTNAYRASDRVSQYLIKNVIYSGESTANEVFFRLMLFKLFNKIETWELLSQQLGDISLRDYSFETYDQVLSAAFEAGVSIYSAAYIMPSAQVFGSRRKHQNHLRLLEKMIAEAVPGRLQETSSMQDGFELLCSYPSIGRFLGYQLITDINYGEFTRYSEMEFVAAGPGARDGIRKCFSDLNGRSDEDVIRIVTERQELEFARLGLRFRNLWGRPLQLIDCQNLFCEVDKYARVAFPNATSRSGRKRIKQIYRPGGTRMNYWYPPKWGLNSVIPNRASNNGAPV